MSKLTVVGYLYFRIWGIIEYEVGLPSATNACVWTLL